MSSSSLSLRDDELSSEKFKTELVLILDLDSVNIFFFLLLTLLLGVEGFLSSFSLVSSDFFLLLAGEQASYSLSKCIIWNYII